MPQAPTEAWAVVLAAGRGTRFGGGTPKQFAQVAGRPLLWWTLHAFARHPELAGLALVLPRDMVKAPPAWLASVGGVGGTVRLTLVAGGAERGDSVWAALQALPASAVVVVVHDGVRPCVTPVMISASLARAREGVGAVLGRPVAGTLKEVGDSLEVRGTVARAGLWCAETPQAFPRAMLERAYRRAREEGVAETDCAALCERYGERVVMVRADGPNPKVTGAGDLALVEAWLARQGSGGA